MNKIFLALLFVTCLTIVSNAQDSQTPTVKFKLKNISLLPKKVTIVTYQPGDEGNGTEQVTMMPRAAKILTYKVGTKIYLADAKQVDVVMSGQRIDKEKPFLVVKTEDAGKTFDF